MQSNRWAALGLLCLALGLVGCQSDPPTITPPVPTRDPYARVTAAPEASSEYTIEPVGDDLALGFERFAFQLKDAGGQPLQDGTVETVFYATNSATGETIRKASGPAFYFGGDQPDGGAWVVYTEFDTSGTWSIDVTAFENDGSQGLARRNFNVIGRTDTPFEGQAVPFGDTPTAADVDDLSEISSASSPDEELYRMSVADAAASGMPTVVFFGSPEHCETQACRATYNEIRTLDSRYASRVNFIHVESRDLEDPSQLSEAAIAWGIEEDPWTFVLNSRGFVDSRVQGGVDDVELGLLIDRALSSR